MSLTGLLCAYFVGAFCDNSLKLGDLGVDGNYTSPSSRHKNLTTFVPTWTSAENVNTTSSTNVAGSTVITRTSTTGTMSIPSKT